MRTVPRTRFRDVATLLSSLVWIGACGLLKAPPPAPAPTLAQIENATYSGVLEQPVALQNGSYAGAPFVESGDSRPAVLLWNELIAFGDLDGSPGDEAAVLLSGTSGGSGERVYLAVVGVRDGQAVNLGTALVGDRVKLRTLTIVAGDVALDLVEPGGKDPACCPTQLARRLYHLENTEVRLISTEAQGNLSVQALDGDWQLVWLDHEAPPPGLRLPTLTLKSARVSGFSGCNMYTGSIEERAPGEIKVSPLNSTRMACPPDAMNLEQEFLQRLGRVDRYTFLAGRLALSGARGDNRFLLLLSVKPAQTAEK